MLLCVIQQCDFVRFIVGEIIVKSPYGLSLDAFRWPGRIDFVPRASKRRLGYVVRYYRDILIQCNTNTTETHKQINHSNTYVVDAHSKINMDGEAGGLLGRDDEADSMFEV